MNLSSLCKYFANSYRKKIAFFILAIKLIYFIDSNFLFEHLFIIFAENIVYAQTKTKKKNI